MSGGSGYDYVVVSAEELNRRAVAEVRGRCESLTLQLVALRAEAASLGRRAARERSHRSPAGTDLTRWQQHEAMLRAELAEAEADRDAARVERWSAELRASGRSLTGRLELGIAEPTGKSDAADVSDTSDASLEPRVLAAVELAGVVTDEAVRAALVAEGDRVLAAREQGEAIEAERRLVLLQAEVQRAVREQRADDLRRRRAADLVVDLGGIGGPEAQVLAGVAGALAAGSPTDRELDGLAAEVASLRERSAREADRAFVVAQAAEALRELGHEVDETFEAEAVAGRPVVARPPGSPSHGLQLRFDPATGQLLTNVVAWGETTPAEDVAAEEASCADLDRLEDDLDRRGVRATRTFVIEAGEAPVMRLTAAPRTDGKRKQKKQAARTRTVARPDQELGR